MKHIRIVIVDDHEMVRSGLRAVFRQVPGFECVGEAATIDRTLAVVAEQLPDVVIMDRYLPDGDGIEACRTIRTRHPHVQVIILTCFSDDAAWVASLLAGASGFLPKETACPDLVEGIRAVAAGNSLLDLELWDRILERLRSNASRSEENGDYIALSQRERHILALIAHGQTTKEIAHNLVLSEKTVRNYVSSLLAKLKVNNRAEAAALAVRENLLD